MNIPIMKDCPNYGHWKRLIKVWIAVTSVNKAKQADCIILTLDSDAQANALKVKEEDRRKDDGSGVTLVLKELDALYEQNITQKLFSAYEDFENFSRPAEMSIAKFINDFELKAKVLNDLDVKLPESLLAFKLLKSSNLGEECTRIVRVAVNTKNPTDVAELTLKNMKTTILNAFDVRLSGQSSDISGQSSSSQQDTIKQEPLDVYYQNRANRGDSRRNSLGDSEQKQYQSKFRGSWRDNKRRSSRDPYPVSRPEKENESPGGYRTNKIDKFTGEPSKCRLCGSIYHWARQCPKYEKQLQEASAALEAHTVDVTLLAHSLENSL